MSLVKNAVALATCVVFVVACGPSEQSEHPKQSGNSDVSVPAPPKTDIKVITDAATIASMRPASSSTAAQIDQMLMSVEKGYSFVNESELVILQMHSESVKPKLRAMIKSDVDVQSGKAAVRAAQVLLRLGDTQGGEYLQKKLSLGGTHAVGALHALSKLSPNMFADWPKFAPMVVTLIGSKDDNVAQKAAAIAGQFELQEAVPALEFSLHNPSSSGRLTTARILSQLAPSAASLEVVKSLLFDNKRTRGTHAFVNILEPYLRGSDPGLATEARAMLVKYWRSEKVATDNERNRKSLMRLLVKYASVNELPILHEMWMHDVDYGPKGQVLMALARLEGTDALEKVNVAAKGTNRHLATFAPTAIGVIYTGTHEDSAVATLLSWVRQKYVSASRVVTPLIDIGGPVAINAALELWPQLGPDDQRKLMWRLNDITVETLAERLSLEGYIKADSFTPFDEYGDPTTAYTLMENSGFLMWFDVETGVVPSSHHGLIQSIANTSRGAINIDWVDQIWNQSHEKDYDANYTVRLAMNNYLFEFTAENHGDWYDIKAVQDALNFALEKVERNERVYSLYTGDQTAIFVVAAEPLRLLLQDEYFFTFESNANAARNTGKAFEQETIERLKKKYGNKALIQVN